MGPIRCPVDSVLGEPCRRLAGHEGEHRFASPSRCAHVVFDGRGTLQCRLTASHEGLHYCAPAEPAEHLPSRVTDTITPRGFRGYGEIPTRDGDTITVVESSLAGEGAHVRIYNGHQSMFPSSGNPRERVPEHYRNCLHLNVAQTLALTSALLRFADDALAGRLTEPAEYTEEVGEPCAMFMGTGERCALPVGHDGYHSGSTLFGPGSTRCGVRFYGHSCELPHGHTGAHVAEPAVSGG